MSLPRAPVYCSACRRANLASDPTCFHCLSPLPMPMQTVSMSGPVAYAALPLRDRLMIGVQFMSWMPAEDETPQLREIIALELRRLEEESRELD